MVQQAMRFTWRTGRRLAIALSGGAVLLAGLAMIVLPGPAVLTIPAGLGILAVEFEWAERWLDAATSRLRSLTARRRRRWPALRRPAVRATEARSRPSLRRPAPSKPQK